MREQGEELVLPLVGLPQLAPQLHLECPYRLDGIRVARSHPQALAQVEDFLRKHGIQPEVAFDTAGAAAEVAEAKDPAVAAVASRRAAERYGLEVLPKAHSSDSWFGSDREFPSRFEVGLFGRDGSSMPKKGESLCGAKRLRFRA